jgi:hypothetical protein
VPRRPRTALMAGDVAGAGGDGGNDGVMRAATIQGSAPESKSEQDP